MSCILNINTNRCVNENKKIGKTLLRTYSPSQINKYRNECESKNGKCSKKKKKSNSVSGCILNDKTNRCVDKNGNLGKKLLERYTPSEKIKYSEMCISVNGKCRKKRDDKRAKRAKRNGEGAQSVEPLSRKSKSKSSKSLIKSRPPSPSISLRSLSRSRPPSPSISLRSLSRSRPPSPSMSLKSKISKDIDCIDRSLVPPLPHQTRVINWLSDNRGIIAVHKVGSGKTLTAVISSQCFLDKFPHNKVLIISPKTLISNFKKEMIQYGLDENDKRYEFYSFEGFLNKKHENLCKNNFLIVDEAHTLRTEVPSEEKIKKKMENRKFLKKINPHNKASKVVECSKLARKVLLLTATPFVNTSYDLANLVAMVKGVDPLDKMDWIDMWGKSDYFDDLFSYHVGKSVDFPTQKIHEVFLDMTPSFYNMYKELENKNIDKAMDFLLKGNPYSFLTGFRTALLKLEDSAKIKFAEKKIIEDVKEDKKIVIYSNFIESGIKKIEKFLKDNNIDYRSIVGSMSAKERKNSIDDYNSGKIQVLLLSKAGGVGIDLKETNDMIILDVPWNKTNLDQAIGRVARYRSHINLPKSQQKVDIYILYSKKPQSVQKDVEARKIIPSADMILYNLIKKKEKEENSVMMNIEKYSIEDKEFIGQYVSTSKKKLMEKKYSEEYKDYDFQDELKWNGSPTLKLTEMSDCLKGIVVDRYLANGAYGLVYKVKYKGKDSAMKVLLIGEIVEPMSDENTIASVEKEYETMEKLSKINIGPKIYLFKLCNVKMPLYSGSKKLKIAIIISELMDITLSDYVQENIDKLLDIKDSNKFIESVNSLVEKMKLVDDKIKHDSLKSIKSLGINNDDIHMSNVMFNNKGIPYIIDWGMSRYNNYDKQTPHEKSNKNYFFTSSFLNKLLKKIKKNNDKSYVKDLKKRIENIKFTSN